MIKLFKQMRRKEALMALLCAVLVVGQVWFELRLPDYMTQLTTLIKTPGSTSGDIWNVGVQMLLVTLGSAVLSIGTAAFWRRNAPRASALPCAKSCSITDGLRRGDAGLFRAEPHHAHDERHHADPDDRCDGIADDDQGADHGRLGRDQNLGKSWELSAVTAAFVVVLCGTVLAIMASCLPRFRLVQKTTDQINRVAREPDGHHRRPRINARTIRISSSDA